MSKKLIALNLFLVAVTGTLGWQLFLAVNRFNSENNLAKLQPIVDVKQRIAPEGGLPPLQPARKYNAAEFAAIPNQNLFSETRAREDKTEAPAVAEVPPLSIRPVLVGVTITGSQRLASIIDPTVPAGAHRVTLKRPGDVFMGYVITDITDSQIVLESGTRREIIPLDAGNKRSPQAGKTAILATRVVPFSGGGGGPAGTVIQGGGAVAISAGAARPTSTVPTPGANPTAAREGPMGSSSGVVMRPGQQPQLQQGRQAPATQWNEGVDSQGRRVIRTPFGDIPRDRPPDKP
jgi:hypothetical protein